MPGKIEQTELFFWYGYKTLRKEDGSLYFFVLRTAWKYQEDLKNWVQIPFNLETDKKKFEGLTVYEYDKPVKVGSRSFFGRIIYFNYKGGQAEVVDLPDDESDWADERLMRVRDIQVPFMSLQKIGSFYWRVNVFHIAKDEYIFVKFCTTFAFYRMFVFSLPYGNPLEPDLKED